MIGFKVQSPDRNDNVDPTVQGNLLRYFPEGNKGNITIVPISYMENFTFRPPLLNLHNQWVMVDFLEYFGQQGAFTHLIGMNVAKPYDTEEWLKFGEWVKENPPLMYFKRELLAKDASDKLKPIEFACYLEAEPIQTKAEFDARPFDVFNCWGFSNCVRPALHGEIFKQMCGCQLNVISGFDQIETSPRGPRTWVTIFTPHLTRRPIEEVMKVQRQSKLSVSLPGSGVKCFRSTESPVNCVPAFLYDQMAWSVPWIHRQNCYRLIDPYYTLLGATGDPFIYDIYVNAQETIDRYRGQRYVNEYIMPEIEKML